MNGTNSLHRYVHILLAIVLTVTVMYFGKDLILLFVISGLLAFLLLPLARKVELLGAPRWVGALAATLVMLFLVLGIFFLVGWQLTRFGEDLPALQQAFATKGQALQVWIEDLAHISQRDQLKWFNARLADLASSGGNLLMQVFSGTGAILAAIVPIPIIVFLLLLLKDKFRTFFEQLGSSSEGLVLDIMLNVSKLSRKYLRGVLLVILILGALSSVGFLLLDLKYALLLGFTIGFLNVIPYVGVLIGSLLPIIIALVTKDSMMYAVGALGVCLFTQFLENNFITPKIVGSSVSVNPLASIAALIGFGLLWGVVGMVLAIPITGMLKIVCDSIPSLKPYGYILGEDIDYPDEQQIHLPLINPRKVKK
ncbi:MAG: AI-2E family transporter [Flavobacteriales bacterium]|jgi:predicted PurR-regulated permease PerM|nr:AI-2E family transporter [Flavobacteriales bacterium]MBK9514058.1 AI-2E family transporter [Flavobacteriales bacterium]MBP7448396.1 AI-2E family transporter [Flavobacteriales bacterium]HOZ40490.1 AI-2E family transporter [Flavobacteriales bacterium]